MKRLIAIALVVATPLFAQKKPLTFEAIYDPVEKVYFNGALQSDCEWLDDTTVLWPRKDEQGQFEAWRLYDVTTGKERPLFVRAKLTRALTSLGVPEDVAKAAAE